MNFIAALKWIALPIASFPITYVVLLTVLPLMPIGYPYEIPVAGSIGAFTLVVSAAFLAPSNINITAVLYFIMGVLISFRFLSSLTEPDSLTPTYVPMFFTYLSGAIGVVTIYYIDRKSITIASTWK